ncbi:MAG: glycosyltransferase family 2 protein [Myxococcota bacterium]
MSPNAKAKSKRERDQPFYLQKRPYLLLDQEPLPVTVVLSTIDSRAWFTEKFVLPSIRSNAPAQTVVVSDSEMTIQQKRNYGLEQAESEFIFFCDDDVILPADHLRRLVAALEERDERFAFAYTDYQGVVLEPDSHPRGENYYVRARPFESEQLRRGNYVSMMSLVRRRLCPKFDETLPRYQDWDIWLTLVERGHEGVYVPDTGFFAFYLDSGITSSEEVRKTAREMIERKHRLKR